ncbi:MAG TPA: aminoglycoside phosphotransferase family protein [Cellulomonas sp.]|uniref:aminoglycoside phosphotransferase family protein n=1 Tax=Cellulomonas sp. TaxID=40001 RepID=UPI002E378DEC|nr:aminoglycoside phosphotransferase family protein [Cellulomonas sp.]HEX5331080.1 aminoglycoside phosphotransferase family protein [Cellulomonas sp.]
MQPVDLDVPAILRDGIGRTHGGAAWIDQLPELVERAVVRWGLEFGEPFRTGYASWCAPTTAVGGRDAVLKIVFPHDEARHESVALRAWDGRGAVRLLDDAPEDWALLLEHVRPGTPMTEWDATAEERLTAGADVHRELCGAVAEPGSLVPDDLRAALPSVLEVCRGWSDLLADRAARAAVEGDLDLDPGLVALAVTSLRDLPASADADVVVHGDLNPGNLLRAPDGRWVVIDPKPMRGDPAFDLWPLLSQVDAPFRRAGAADVLRPRLDLVADRTGLDAQRVAAWSVARACEQALWTWAELGDLALADRELQRAAVWASLVD